MGVVAASADLRDLAADLAFAGGTEIERTAAQLITQTAQEIRAYAMGFAPKKTGKLMNTIHITYRSPTSVSIGPEVDYGPYQEFGTGTKGEFPGGMYEIRPKKPDGYLVFQKDGKTIFTKLVKHPGVPPHPYMRPAFEQATAPFAAKLADKAQSQITRGPRA